MVIMNNYEIKQNMNPLPAFALIIWFNYKIARLRNESIFHIFDVVIGNSL